MPRRQIVEHEGGSGRKWKTFHGPNGEFTKSRVTALSSDGGGGGGGRKVAGGGGGKAAGGGGGDGGGGGGGGGGGARATSARATSARKRAATAKSSDGADEEEEDEDEGASAGASKKARGGKAASGGGGGGGGGGGTAAAKKSLQQLIDFIQGQGGDEEALDGWYSTTEQRKSGDTAGTSDKYYINPDGAGSKPRSGTISPPQPTTSPVTARPNNPLPTSARLRPPPPRRRRLVAQSPAAFPL